MLASPSLGASDQIQSVSHPYTSQNATHPSPARLYPSNIKTNERKVENKTKAE